MHRTFTFQEFHQTTQSEMVELPIYSQHDLDRSTIYHKLFARTDQGYVIQQIHTNADGETSFKEQLFIGSDLGRDARYYLGKGEFSSSKAAWSEALNAAKAAFSFYEP